MKKVVRVTSVEHDITRAKRDGGTYQCTVLNYIDDRGEQSKPFASTFLSKNTTLSEQLSSLTPDCNAEIELKKVGNFWNIVSVVPTTAAATKSTSSAPAKKSFSTGGKSFDSVGMQIGNALNVAATTLGPNTKVQALRERAYEVLQLSEELRAHLTGTTASTTATDIKVGGTSSEEDVESVLSELAEDNINFDD